MQSTQETIKTNKNMQNYNSIDLMKFICVILVVCIHAEPISSYNMPLNFFVNQILARIAVPFFFLTSGYLFFIKININKFNFNDNIERLKKTISRIFIMYVLWEIIYFTISSLSWIQSNTFSVDKVTNYLFKAVFVGNSLHLWYLLALMFSLSAVYILLKYIKLTSIIKVSFVLYLIGLIDQTYYGIFRNIPFVNNVINIYNKSFVTTRNGLFFGILFLAVGAYISQIDITKIKKIYCFIGWSISFMLLTSESIILQQNDIAVQHDMYLMLIPASVFLFLYTINVRLPDSRWYKEIREMSTVIYTSHPLFLIFLPKVFNLFNAQPLYENSALKFITVLSGSVAFSFLVTHLSDKYKNMRFLKALY